MLCPVDQAELSILPKVPGLAESCEVCGGLWVERASLRQLGAALPAGSLDAQPVEPRRCSRCEVPMGRLRLPGVEVDVCPDCQGVWLDAGELATLKSLRRSAATGAGQPTAAPRGGVGALDAALVTVDFAATVVDFAGLVFDLLG